MFPSFLIAKKDFSRMNGYHTGGTTGLTNSGISLNRHDLAKIIIHVAGHNKLGEHTCGKWADADENGPYGLGAYFMVGQYWNAKMQHANGRPAKYKPDMSIGEGTLALSSAYDIAKNRFCNNQAAAQKVYTYLPKSNI